MGVPVCVGCRGLRPGRHLEDDDIVPELANIHPRERPDWEETISAMVRHALAHTHSVWGSLFCINIHICTCEMVLFWIYAVFINVLISSQVKLSSLRVIPVVTTHGPNQPVRCLSRSYQSDFNRVDWLMFLSPIETVSPVFLKHYHTFLINADDCWRHTDNPLQTLCIDSH